MKRLYIYLLILSVLTSCDDGFMDRYPQTSIAPEEFFKSEEDLALYVNGLLQLPGMGQYEQDQSSDNLATTGAIEVKSIMTGSPNSQNITAGWDWARLRNINYFLDNIANAQASQEAINHFEGLARFYRAWFYFNMVKRYSDLPWYGELLAPTDEALYKPRDPRALVMQRILEDLEFAAAHVREQVPSGTPGIWAVKTLYARVALYEGTFRKYHPELNIQETAQALLTIAEDVSQEIIASGNFSIYQTGNPERDYATLFNSLNLVGNPEIILVNPHDVSKDRSSNINYTVFGTYEQSPSRDLVQTYLMRDGSRFTDIPGYETFLYVEEFQDRDPRLSQTLVYPGWVRSPDPGPFIPLMNRNFTGYFQQKGYNNTIDNVDIGSLDFPVMRYAEVLLTYAEAKAELGTLTQSDLDASVNRLRNRAGMPPLELTAANSSPDARLMEKYPNVSGPMTGVLLEIRRERRVEFALEGYRFDDLMRWGAGKLLERIPEGMYFPGLGKYDLTGDGVEDIILIDKDSNIPSDPQKETNSLGERLIYYRAGTVNDNVTVYLRNGVNGGTLVTETAPRQFMEPKYYYRPVPIQQVVLNPNLEQIFGWE
ncbi:RagB/SusD family nutrient uptake outer membrane protein [Negadavirga shengliensis]|uniref:RagB/SusD family nutrient uptake outer membrane protein n=1 Tax=Negadavirga shengliensis TaxID=1389218 RepID=A0ABV9T3X2_9BACT